MKLRIMAVFFVMLLAVSCGAQPQVGGFLKIDIPGYPDSMVSVDDQKPVKFSELEQPLDLMANPHKITITWPQTGQTTVEYVNVEYGKTVEFSPKLPQKESIEIISSMPGTVIVGKTDLGHSSKLSRAELFTGENTFDVRLDGFSYAWTTKAIVAKGAKIVLEPGTDDTHGALYIKSDSPGVEFSIEGTDQQQKLYQGSSFTPNILPGKLVITEINMPSVKHFVQIKPGMVTKVNNITSFQNTDSKQTTIESFGKTSFYIGWSSQATEIDITGKKSITSYELDKLTPFRPGTANSRDVFKFVVSEDKSSFGVATISGALPQKISVDKISDAMIPNPNIKTMDIQSWLPQSPDGKWTVSGGMAIGPGSFKFELKGFEPGCWDLKNFTVLASQVDIGNKTFEIREMPLSKMNPMVIGNQTYEPIGEKGLEWVKAYAFYDVNKLPIPVVFSPKWISIFTRNTSNKLDAPLFDLKYTILKLAVTCSLIGRRFLVCKKSNDVLGSSFVVDIENGNVYDNLPNPTITTDGLLACNLESDSNAGIIYKISGKQLIPVWAGIP